jgi:hypothetical protein
MVNVEQLMYEYLTSDATFMANFTAVHYLDHDADIEPPYITFRLVSDSGDHVKLDAIQGEALVQFDVWDSNKIRGARLRGVVAEKIRKVNETGTGYHIIAMGITEQTIPRMSGTDLYHYVVDGRIRWSG